MESITDTALSLLAGVIVLIGFGILMLAILFSSLAVRAAWQWLTGRKWRDEIVMAHRRALR